MRRGLWMHGVGWLGGLALVLVSAAAASAQGPAEGLRFQFNPAQVQVQVQGPGAMAPGPIKLSDHWIGVECYPVRGALQAQLGLAEGQGLLVANVVPDSPAAKGGVEQHDVLLKAGDRTLGKIQDLMEAVDAAGGKKLSLELLRVGKATTVEVEPAKRPAEARPGPGSGPWEFPFPGGESPDWDQIRKWLERVQPGKDGRPPMRFRFFQPGRILPPGAAVRPPLPGNMSVAITKTGDDPAKIVVKQGDKKWEVTEEELDKLPAEIRPHVKRMLGRPALGPGGHAEPFDLDFIPDWVMPPGTAPQFQLPPQERLEKQMEEMNRRIEELRKSLDDLRQKRPRLKAPEKKEPPKDQEKV